MQKLQKFSVFFIFILIISLASCGFISSSVSSSPSIVSSSANLIITIQRDKQMPKDYIIKVTIPSEVSIASSLTKCEQTFILKKNMNCAVSGQQLRITLTQKLRDFILATFQVGPITNPSSTQPTSKFFIQGIPKQVGEAPRSHTLSATAAFISRATFQSQSSNIVGQDSTAILSFTNVNTIPVNGRIQLRFSVKWNPSSPEASRKSYYKAPISCTSFTPPSSNFGACSLNQDTLTLAVTSQIAASTAISFTISSIRNPRSVVSVTGLILRTQNENNYTIDQTNKASLSSKSTYKARSFDTARVNPITLTVGQTSVAQFTMTIGSFPTDAGIYVDIIFPSQVSPSSITDISGSNPALKPKFSTSGNTVRITKIQNGAAEQFTGVFVASRIVNPSSTAPVTSFQYNLYDSLNNIIASQTSGISYSPSVGSLSGLSITPDSTQVSTVTSWKFAMTLSSSLAAVSQIKITLPHKIKLTSSSCSVSQVTTILNSSVCAISSQVITLTNILSSQIAGGTNIQFKISAVITNPITTSSIGAVIFQSRVPADGAYQVNKGELSDPFTLTIGAMTSARVIPSPAVAYQETTLQISMTIGHPYPKVTTILITVPSEIILLELNPTCTSSTTTVACTTPNNSSIQIVTNMSSILPASSTITIKIEKVRNQRTLQNTSTFVFETQSIQSLKSGVFSSISSVPSLNSFSVTPTSFINSAVTKYSFSGVISKTILLDNDTVTITPQSTITNPSGSITCAGTSSNLDSVACAISGSGVKVTLNFKASSGNKLNSGQTLSFTIDGYKNPPTTDVPSDQFSLLIQNSTGKDVATYSNSLFRVQTNTAATMVKSSDGTAFLTINSLIPKNKQAIYTITAQTVTTIPANSLIRINIPTGVVVTTPPTTTCQGTGVVNTIITCTLSSSKTYFQITNGFTSQKTPGKFSISMNNIQNPQTITETPSFGIQIFTQTGGKIDALLTGMTVKVQCNAPCATCDSSTPSECLSCITILAPGGGPYYLQQTSCVESCSTSYLLLGGKCKACTDNCYTCQTTLSRCISCTGAYSLKSNTCVKDCGEGFFSASNVCSACDASANCKTCTGSATLCTSCNGNLVLQGSQCKNSCDKGYVQDSNNICQQCTGSCANCVSSVDNCIQCVSNFFLHNGSCVSSCPANVTIPNNSSKICQNCDATCASCLGQTSSCVTCQSGLLKLGSTCVTQCTSGTTVPVGGVCQSCSLNCGTCESTTTNCVTCPSGQFKIINSDSSQSRCAASCPPGYSPSKGNCILCGEGFKINSSGDGCQAIPTIPTPQSNISFVIFPFLLAALVGVALAGISKLVEKSSYFCSTIAIFWAFLELFALATQIVLAVFDNQTIIFIITAACFLMLILCNIFFAICYCTKMKKDAGFAKSFLKHKKCFSLIAFLSNFLNYKIIRFHYAYCFGVKAFQHQFSNVSDNFLKPLFAITLMSIVLVNLPIIILDLSMVIFSLSWGEQLFITCIETLILELLIIIISIPEMISFRNPQFGARQFGFYDKINQEVDDYSREQRIIALRKLIDNNRDNIPQLDEDEFEEYDQDDDARSRFSDSPEVYAQPYLNKKAQKRQTLSDPPSPRTRRQIEKEQKLLDSLDQQFVIQYPDNVYFESKPPNPEYSIGKKFKDKNNQTILRRKKQVINEQGQLFTVWEDEDQQRDHDFDDDDDDDDNEDLKSENVDDDAVQNQYDPNEDQRLRKQAEQQEFKREMNQKYNSVNKDMDDIGDKLNHHQVGINAMILEKQAEEKKKEDEKRRLDQEELKKLEQQAAMQEQEDHPEFQNSMGDQQKQSPRIFLEGIDNQEINQLYGDGRKIKKKSSGKLYDMHSSLQELPGFDTMEDRRSLTAITNPGGGATTIGEPEHDLALLYPDLENLDVAPNFIDIDDIRGDLKTDNIGNMIITRNEKGEFVDKQNRRVSRLGFLLDDQDRVINSKGEVVDVLGDFEKDQHGNVKLIPDPAENSIQGEFIDKQGRPVNDRGYLIDREQGHIIDSQGSIVAKKGQFDIGPDGNPIVLFDSHGNQIDKNGRPVNGKGFLIDNYGNIINNNKQISFKEEELSQEEPFQMLPTELLKKRRSSLVTKDEEEMMNQIEKAHGDRGATFNSDNDLFNEMVQSQVNKMRPKSGDSSVNQLMGDTPTYYNHMNGRFEQNEIHLKQKKNLDPNKKNKKVLIIGPKHQFHPGVHHNNIEEDEKDLQEDESSFDLEEEDDIEKYTKKRKLKPKKHYAPRQQDKQMAGIYGGVPQGPLVRRKLKNYGSKAAVRRLPKKSQLDNITNLVSGFGTDHSTLPGMQRGGLGIQSGTRINNSKYLTGPLRTSMQADLNDQMMGELNIGVRQNKSRAKKGKRKLRPDSSRNSDLQRIYAQQNAIGIESQQNSQFNESNYSKLTGGTKLAGQRLTTLQTIYLNRLKPAPRLQSRKSGLKSHSAAPGGRIMSNAGSHGVSRLKQPHFRQMWDRNHDQTTKLINTESEKDDLSFMSEFNKQGGKLMGSDSGRGFGTGNPHLFSGNLPKYGVNENSARGRGGEAFQQWV